MAEALDQFDSDAANVINDFGGEVKSTLNWRGTDYDCTKSNTTETVDSEIEGFLSAYDVMAWLRIASFEDSTPRPPDTAMLDGAKHRVQQVRKNDTTITLYMDRIGA